MSRICHEHCPAGEAAGWFWLAALVGAVGGAVWLLGELLTGLGKTAMTVIAGTGLVVVGVILVVAVRTAVRNSTCGTATAAAAGATKSHRGAEHITCTNTDSEPGASAGSTDEGPAVQGASAGRPRLRLIRGGRAA
ncbi:hypothetical protein [Actinopolymorpha sp. B9G3]|uniref:hypothetical protein n=1 Tax=Actinopolymorpha sp. B9G3 TaxID=3158970 RepID=UPI0032D94E30